MIKIQVSYHFDGPDLTTIDDGLALLVRVATAFHVKMVHTPTIMEGLCINAIYEVEEDRWKEFCEMIDHHELLVAVRAP